MKSESLAKLTISNLEYYAYHGVKKEEKKLGGKYQLDIDVHYDSKNAAINDDINYAVNYEEIVYIVSELMLNESYDLIETLANEILNTIFDKFELVVVATVRIRKMNVPMRRVVKFVEIEQSLERSE
jgi:dihydroneopterin aldolase